MKTQKKPYNLIPVTGKNNSSFVGIKMTADGVNIYYPESFVLSSDKKQERKELLALIRSLGLAKTHDTNSSSLLVADNIGDSFLLDAYLWILRDYSINRVYINTEKKYQANGKGRINWKRTIGNLPIIRNGRFIYKEHIVEINQQRDAIITEIYRFCVRIASEAIGWLIGIFSDEREGIPYNQNQYELALNAELERTFDDTKRERLTVMKSIVCGMNSSNNFSSGFVYGVSNYNYVFERMIDEMFSNISDITEYYPNGEWQLDCFDKKFDTSNLRPDTIIKHPNEIIVLDAKNYRFGSTKKKEDLPNTSSIQKQITYGEYISKQFEISNVINAFVLPYNKQDNELNLKRDLECIGYAIAKWKKQKNIYEYVFTVLIDMSFLIMNWNSRNASARNTITDLLNDSVKNLENAKEMKFIDI